jgi:methionine salvage enolase-phosphatase E1
MRLHKRCFCMLFSLYRCRSIHDDVEKFLRILAAMGIKVFGYSSSYTDMARHLFGNTKNGDISDVSENQSTIIRAVQSNKYRSAHS